MNNKIFVINKPLFISSNNYLRHIKYKYNLKKVGFSGTLAPFAIGTLICASGQYTKLFNYIKKTPKIYKGVIWLGATSDSLDLENIQSIKTHKILNIDDIKDVIEILHSKKDIIYTPPKFSAKKINGKKAYELSRNNQEVKLKPTSMHLFDIKLIHYKHPFITYEACVSEGSYIRSLSQIILQMLNSYGTMSFLHRTYEGLFYFNNEKLLNVKEYINLKENFFLGDKDSLLLGKKIFSNDFKTKENGTYVVYIDNFLSIIEIKENKTRYILNRIEIC
jgi:tRNA pseudouridine55 synthase